MTKTLLTGAWTLDTYSLTFPDGQSIAPLGSSPCGLIVYTDAGWMSVQMYKVGRPIFASPDPTNTTPEGAKAALDGSIAYFGTYTVDATEQIVTHNVLHSVFPNFSKTTLQRKFVLDGPLLRLTSEPMPAGSRGSVVADMVWRKVTVPT